MRTVDLVEGGEPGVWGRLFIFCPEAQLGMGYNVLEDRDVVLAHLLDRAEEILGEQLIMGKVTRTDPPEKPDLITDDERRVLPPPKKKPRSRDYHDKINWHDMD